MNQPSWMEDPVLKRLISEATEDLRTVGLILGGSRAETFLGIVRTGDPKLQQKLEARVEALVRDRGYGNVLDGWGNDIEQIKALHFD